MPELIATNDLIARALRDHAAGELPQAEQICRQVLAAQPRHPAALGLLALIAHHVGRYEAAAELSAQAIAADPNVPAFHVNRAAALNALGRFDDAADCCHAALRLRPDDPLALLNLGNARLGSGAADDAIDAYCAALQLQPRLLQAHNNLGHALRVRRRLDEAADAFRAALALHPNLAEAHANLGNTLKDQGRLAEAIACYRAAVRAAPQHAGFGSNLLYALSFDSRCRPDELFAEHVAWARRHADPLLPAAAAVPPTSASSASLISTRDPDRRLRVGYVSANFRAQVLGLYVEPLLAAHDRERFEIYCYSDVTNPDAATQRIAAHADAWRPVAGVPDAQLAEQIRADRIDILVDMTNHMGDNRLLAFARKPAPVQVSFPHPFTTGMRAMDYVITDPHLDPPGGASERLHTERLLRLPRTYLCYPPPPPDGPQVAASPPPSAAAGHVTFISVNNLCKVNDGVLRAWAAILTELPRSRLLVRLDGGAANSRSVPAWFAGNGVDASRVEFIDALPRGEYLRLFHRADVCLDPFPYAGYTSSLDALWMGVPLVTLAGETALGRFGVSILNNLHMTDLIAHTPQQYVELALRLARDPQRLAELRPTLRQRMQRSPLLDHAAFAADVEAAYRSAWRAWVSAQPPEA